MRSVAKMLCQKADKPATTVLKSHDREQ